MDTTQSLLFRWLGRLPKIISSRERRSPTVAIRLRDDEVVRLTRASGFARVEVRRGTIWLTGTPANSDVLLPAGEHFQFTNDWPFVLQAMGEAEIVLVP
jgi:hypothetical protein